MARTPRKFQEGPAACYHVMNRGHNREAVFGDADDNRYFLGLLARYQKRFPLRLFHYCLMSNHFHLLETEKETEKGTSETEKGTSYFLLAS